MATIYEVSALAGVSLSSVSRVLNNHKHVSEKTKNKVHAAVKALNYQPNAIAKSLASNRTDCIGILVSELNGPFYGELLANIESELKIKDKHLLITAGHSNEQNEKSGIEFLIKRQCDVLILLVDAVSDEYLLELAQQKTPFIVLNRFIPEIDDKCFYIDNVKGGYLAAKMVLEQGHKNIAYISGPLHKQDSLDRLAGHKKALQEYKIQFNEHLLYEGDFLTQGGRDGMNYLLNTEHEFTAVVCANDEMASGAMKGARDNKLTLPDDCSFVGFDNAYFAEYLFPQLSTINYPTSEMAVMCTQWIFKHIYKQEIDTIKNLFIPTLVRRDSTTLV